MFSYFKGLEKGVKSCYAQKRKEGSFLKQFETQMSKNIDFHFSVEIYLKDNASYGQLFDMNREFFVLKNISFDHFFKKCILNTS